MTVSTSDPTAGAGHLIELAHEGRLSKELLVGFLARDKRQPYLDACTTIERRFTAECTAAGDPCLEGGCALEGEVCLQPLLRSQTEYFKACGDAWATLFVDPRNRAEPWQKDRQ